jgi:hypothetical protein
LLILSALIRACPRHQRSIDAFFNPKTPIADPYTELKTDIGRLAAVCAVSEEIMNKGQLTALILGGVQVECVVLHDVLSNCLSVLAISVMCLPSRATPATSSHWLCSSPRRIHLPMG